MKKIGILSDTHSWIDPRILEFFDSCDEIWHAGDIGDLSCAQAIAAHKPLRAVFGNIDGRDVRNHYPQDLRFEIENTDVWITHIGGYPGRYEKRVEAGLKINPPKLFICGHSHILKVIYDKKHQLLHINPGAAGRYGFHTLRTAIRLKIDNGNIMDLEILELTKKIVQQ